MLPHQYRLTSRHEITAAMRRGRRSGSTHLVVHIAPSPRTGPARAAFAVSSTVGNSVVRHRLIRQLRAAVRPLLDRLPEGTDLVVRALPAARDASFADLTADLEHALRHDLLPASDLPASDVPASDPPAYPPSEAHTVGEAPSAVKTQPGRHGIGQVLYLLGTPLRWLLIGFVFVYRRVISPVLPPTCRYHPSCSAYALESLQVHGVVRGVGLTAWRIGRCNPFTKGGLDPVPPRGAWRPEIHPDGTPRDPDGAGDPTRAVGLPDNPGTLLQACTPKA